MITAETLRTLPGEALLSVCAWCVPVEQLAYLALEHHCTFGMCPACQADMMPRRLPWTPSRRVGQ